ncbi:MAG: Gfo/Idh/MocA family oxidoreductase [Candidatus Omnitrophota bacterium]
MANPRHPDNNKIHRRTFIMGFSAASIHAAFAESSAAQKIRIGVVGGGFGCSFYWHEHPNCVVAAVSDLRPDRRDRLVQTYHCDQVYESLEKLILDKTIDAVAVFTGAPDHVRHCSAVMNSGKHALSAVPAAMSLEECQTLIDVKIKTGMTYMMAETSYYRQEAITARQWYKEGKFGKIFSIEAEYHHDMTHDGPGLIYYNGQRTWRYGFPPMHYPTHALAFAVSVTGERMTQVSCIGDRAAGNPVYQENAYNNNPFCNATALYKTNKGNAVRHAEFRHAAAGVCERAQWYGDKMSFFMPTPNGTPATIFRIGEKPETYNQPMHWKTDLLPEPLRHDSGHGGSHTFITHEFITALRENRRPAVDVYEAAAYTAPGIVAHQSALKDGELLTVPDFG